MPILENTQTRLSIKSGSTTLTLDTTSGKITLQRKLLFWQQKPLEKPLSEVVSVSVDAAVDRASGVRGLPHDGGLPSGRRMGVARGRQE